MSLSRTPLSRRRFLATGSTAILAGTVAAPHVARAQRADFTYKYANNLPDTHPMNIRAREMAEALRTESGGRFDLKIFPSSQLGSDTDTLSQLRSGSVEFFTMSPLILSTLVPERVDQRHRLRLPGLRGRVAGAWTANSAPASAQQIAKAGLVAMEKIWDNGYRQIDLLDPADRHARRLQGLPDPRAGLAALDLDVPGLRRLAGLDQPERDLLGAADQDRRGPGEPAGGDRHDQALRGAEILLAHQPHVGRLLVPGQPARLGAHAGGPARDRGQAHRRRRR